VTATAERIQKSPRLIELLGQYHGGGGSGVYSVMSRLFAGIEVPRDDEHVDRAIAELRKHQVWALEHAPEEAEDKSDTRAVHMRETEELIDWLEEDQDLIAHRRIGEVDIFIECKEPDAQRPHRYWYECRVECEMRPGEKASWKTTVGAPVHSDVAVDSGEAYDRVARSALTFATHDPGDEDQDQFPDDTERQAFEERGGWCYDEEGTEYLVTRP